MEARTAVKRPHPRAGVYLCAAGVAAALLLSAIVLGLDRSGPRTAFAEAPVGSYAIVVRAGATLDELLAVPVAASGEEMSLGAIEHVPGWTSTGTVSPDGRTAAVVAVDGGSAAHPSASLLFVDLETGGVFRALGDIDPRQKPPWDPTGTQVAVSRTRTGGEAELLTVRTDGQVDIAATVDGVAGLFPFAIDAAGDVWSCAIGADGSVLVRGRRPVRSLGPFATRDWTLSPDGGAVAYIEVNTESGVRYYPRVAELGGPVRQASISASGPQALGVAWRSGDPLPTFGIDPAMTLVTEIGGFDVPLGYSPSGRALAVAHWTGNDYAAPGDAVFEAITDEGRVTIEPASRFLGWAER